MSSGVQAFCDLLRRETEATISVDDRLELVKSWEFSWSEISRAVNAGRPPDAPMDLRLFVASGSPFEITAWQSFYLTLMRGEHKGCQFIARQFPNRAAIELLMVRGK